MIKNICSIGLNDGFFLFHPFGVMNGMAMSYKNVNPSGFNGISLTYIRNLLGRKL